MNIISDDVINRMTEDHLRNYICHLRDVAKQQECLLEEVNTINNLQREYIKLMDNVRIADSLLRIKVNRLERNTELLNERYIPRPMPGMRKVNDGEEIK